MYTGHTEISIGYTQLCRSVHNYVVAMVTLGNVILFVRCLVQIELSHLYNTRSPCLVSNNTTTTTTTTTNDKHIQYYIHCCINKQTNKQITIYIL